MGESGSCPIAETSGVADRVHRADQGLVGEREQVLDRATAAGDDDHVDVRVAVERPATASITSRAACMPCIAAYFTVKWTPGQRRRPLSRTSRSAAEFWAVTSPTLRGRNGSGRLQLLGEQSLGREQLAPPLEAGQQLTLADEPDLADGERERAAVGVERRLGVADDLRALDQRRGQRVDDRRGCR